MDGHGPRSREWRISVYRLTGSLNILDLPMEAKEVVKWEFCDTCRVAAHGWRGGRFSTTLNLVFRFPGEIVLT